MSGFIVRSEAPDDHAGVRRVHLAAFPGVGEADLVDLLREDAAWIPGLSLVAVCELEVVGHVLMTRLRVGEGDALALAPLAVVPEMRGRGVGAGLMRAVLAAAERARERLVVVLGDPQYYGRFGFGPARELGVVSPFDVPDEVFQALALPAYEGSPRGRAVYPEPFGVV